MDIFKLGDILEQSDIPGLCNAWTVTGQFQGRRSLGSH